MWQDIPLSSRWPWHIRLLHELRPVHGEQGYDEYLHHKVRHKLEEQHHPDNQR